MNQKILSIIAFSMFMFALPMAANSGNIFTEASGAAAVANIPGLVNTAVDGLETVTKAGADRAAAEISGMSNNIESLSIRTTNRVDSINTEDSARVSIGDTYLKHVKTGSIDIRSENRVGKVQVDRNGVFSVGRFDMTDTSVGNVDYRGNNTVGKVNVGSNASVSLGNAFIH